MKKKLNIFLMVLVLLVYGAILYKFFGKQSKAVTEDLEDFTIVQTPEFKIAPEDYEFELSDRDPFLGKISRNAPKVETTVVESRNTTQKPISKVPAVWPEIKYIGYLETEGSKKVAVIKIEGTIFRFTPKQIHKNVQLNWMRKDSIQLMYKGLKRIVKK